MTAAQLSAADLLLNRRPMGWYVGKVLLCTGRGAPQGWPEGYYVATGVREGRWELCWLGPVAPEHVPIYRHDGRHQDLRAVPSTVVPRWYHWVVWPLLWVAIWAVGYQFMYEAGSFLGLCFLPVLLTPLWVWFFNVEPVRATKVAAAIGAAQLALAAHRHFEDKSYMDHTHAIDQMEAWRQARS